MPQTQNLPTVQAAQGAMNEFTARYCKGVPRLRVDGRRGQLTNARIRHCKWWVGYSSSRRNATIDHEFMQRLRHPSSRKYADKNAIQRGHRRRVTQRKRWEKEHEHARVSPGVVMYDGVPCCECAVPILDWCKAHGWHGWLVSGWRSKEHSRQLCIDMCGHPTCPGRCAGVNTNHVGNTCARFAVDVAYYVDFRHIVARCPVKPRIFNALPVDPVHFSVNGR